ncbi:MAG TPA: ribosomal protein S18-alanine N-acetyltransferase [Acidimicrobiales bacterium]|nr:ribosomal protein S18-alanine N-acetyltransferase [Acidimicrobiales bacterium]
MSLRRTRTRLASKLPLPPRNGEVVEITPMRRRDVPAVVAIEKEIFPEPWSQNLYLSELAQRSTRRYYVAISGGMVVGYAGCMLVVGEAHITTIGVAQAWQGRKIGARLLYRLVAEARDRGAETLILEVRVSNRPAQRLYEWFGFAPIAIRKNYYVETKEDGLVMQVVDTASDAYGERLSRIGKELNESEREKDAGA